MLNVTVTQTISTLDAAAIAAIIAWANANIIQKVPSGATPSVSLSIIP